MRRLRILLVLLVLWLLSFFSIERFSAPINISRIAYPIAPLMAVLIILIPRLRKVPLWLLILGPAPVYIFLKSWAGYELWGTSLPLTVTELCAISVTTILSRWIGTELSQFEEAIAHISIGQVEESAAIHLYGQAEMYREVKRARQYHRPLSLMMIGIEDQSIQVALNRIVQETQHALMKRFVISDVARTLCDELEDYNLITLEDDHFLVLLPEINSEKLKELVDRLRKSVASQVGVDLQFGAASFPDDAVTFESLMEKAHKGVEEKLQSRTATPSLYKEVQKHNLA